MKTLFFILILTVTAHAAEAPLDFYGSVPALKEPQAMKAVEKIAKKLKALLPDNSGYRMAANPDSVAPETATDQAAQLFFLAAAIATKSVSGNGIDKDRAIAKDERAMRRIAVSVIAASVILNIYNVAESSHHADLFDVITVGAAWGVFMGVLPAIGAVTLHGLWNEIRNPQAIAKLGSARQARILDHFLSVLSPLLPLNLDAAIRKRILAGDLEPLRALFCEKMLLPAPSPPVHVRIVLEEFLEDGERVETVDSEPLKKRSAILPD